MKNQMYDTIDGRVLRNFQILKKVGQGAYGQVWKARNKKTGATCALKKMYEAFRNTIDAQKTYREIRYLQKLDHPSIVRLLAVHRPACSRDVYLEMQFMEADLCLAVKNSLLKQIHKHFIFYQLANTLAYLHAADLVHRDIKPSNILVNETCEVKLCDFGLIRSIRKDSPGEELVLTEDVTTKWYRAPQILLGSNSYGKEIDVWSMGCVLAEMVMEKPIFKGSSTISQLQKIFQVTGRPETADLDFLKNKLSLNLIENMEIKERKSIRQLLNTNDNHIVDLLQGIFQVDPRKRPTAAQIMNHPFVSRFRGKVEEKVPEGPIRILYQAKQLNIEDYKKLIFGEVDQRYLKASEPAPSPEELIYKTMPSDLGRKNMIGGYSWGNLERKSPLHSSNMSQKNLSPFAFRLKQRTEEQASKSQDKKRERLSPSFLQNRKKEGNAPGKQIQTKASIPTQVSHPEKPLLGRESGSKQLKKWIFPLANRTSQSPEKKENLPYNYFKAHPRVNFKASSSTNLLKTNPQKAENDSKLHTIYEPRHSEQFYNGPFQLKRYNKTEISKSKQKRDPPRFLLNEKRNKDITPNKQKVERPTQRPSRSPIKSISPFSKGPPLHQQSLNFKSSRLSPSSIHPRATQLPQGQFITKITK